MRKFKAQESARKPFINFYTIKDAAEDDPLVILESELPELAFGVYPYHIVDGELVNWTLLELEAFEAEFLAEEVVITNRSKVDVLESETFIYDGKEFPMDASSRLYYAAIDNQRANANIRAIDGISYTLITANIDAFLNEYFKIVLSITQHEF